ncbi:Riboflavin synthase [Candidatus Bilamarchaeum dharawalense]|uniref:6,7-dimethyl-8-ribityllumazine synthase n=1 Tax=Candidatus Bilamarchaeum dharawalense TaxID=2885759 RepID=A0A5E4LQP5_9ARCH|nr:Riboflavin synthase [Candidatus Bilamarchaeum dharawalense]
MVKIGIVDTTFARVNMGEIALDELKKFPNVETERRTVPGIKDLPVECKILLEKCDVCIALGMVGGAPIDQQCGHEASLGIQQAKLMTNKHIIEVFVHENEGWNEAELKEIFENRIRKHARNAMVLATKPEELVKLAGKGIRQGKEDEGGLDDEKATVIGIVVSEFNEDITERMEDRAVEIIKEENISAKIIHVPGVYDMPLVVKKLLMDKKIDGVITLGAVVKGETAHDEVITKDVAKRLGELSLEFRKPVTLGIIGHNAEQEIAEERAEEYAERAVRAVIDLIEILKDDVVKQVS